ncbi:uncharacterized protein LOC113204333 [Frankliniella occidentalis]|uniref:Uncharacterized protein LOC113204333 n=1 Tax=Frankliniella occidentalis TaxID=133901 RepID=A0A6J1S3Q1_FRAOC|nr:uncharacterized protein LOC113204333 [Frankliniella occidentalis]
MALLQRGCFCCELRTCVRIQAWLGLLGAILNIAVGVLLLAIMADLIPQEHLPEQLRTPRLPSNSRRAAVAAAIRTMKIQQALAGSIALLNGLINLAIDIALIYGCKKENRRLLMPALIWFAFALLFMLVMSIVAIITTPVKIAAIAALGSVPILGLSLYFWLHILSYYLELRDEDRELKRQTL